MEESRRQHIKNLTKKLVRHEVYVTEHSYYYSPVTTKKYQYTSSKAERKAAMRELKSLANDPDYKIRKLANSELEYVRMMRMEDLTNRLKENSGVIITSSLLLIAGISTAGYFIYNFFKN